MFQVAQSKILAVIAFTLITLAYQPLVFSDNNGQADETRREFAGGGGGEDDPYLVETAEHLNNIRYHLNAHFILTANIDLIEYGDGEGWGPIGNERDTFLGKFKGNGFTIMNLSINRPRMRDVGLFGVVDKGAWVQDIALENINIMGESHVGGIAGRNLGIIIGCRASGEVIARNHAGGLVGSNFGEITNSSSGGRVTAEYNAGGLVGANVFDRRDRRQFNLTITRSYSSATVVGNGTLGGLVGRNNIECMVFDSHATGDVTGSGSDVGGLVGINSHVIDNCHATGNVEGDNAVGGLVGNNGGIITQSYSEGNVKGTTHVGGLVGIHFGATVMMEDRKRETGIITDSYATGNVTGNNRIGGLVGANQAKITNAYAEGDIDGDSLVGGMVGDNRGNISACSAKGNVSGGSYVGGLVGRHGYDLGLIGHGPSAADIKNSQANGNVKGRRRVGGLVGSNHRTSNVTNCRASGGVSGEEFVGGLVGENDGNIQTSYAEGNVAGLELVGGLAGGNSNNISDSAAWGNVAGENVVGGLVGMNMFYPESLFLSRRARPGAVTRSYSAGKVDGQHNAGGLIGINSFVDPEAEIDIFATVADSYYDKDAAGLDDEGKGMPRSTAEMMRRATYVGWDFVNIWTSGQDDMYLRLEWSPVPEGRYKLVINAQGEGHTVPEIGVYLLKIDEDITIEAIDGEAWNFDHWRLDDLHRGVESVIDVQPAGDGESRLLRVYFSGFAGGTGTEEDPYRIATSEHLALARNYLNKHFIQTADIDLGPYGEDEGWKPFGGPDDNRFQGSFDGNGHRIINLVISREDDDYIGLFGVLGESAHIRNVELENVRVRGKQYVGALAGVNKGKAVDCRATGNISGKSLVGGLFGNNEGRVRTSLFYGEVTGLDLAGGLCGENKGGIIIGGSFEGRVFGGEHLGGLVGRNWEYGMIAYSYAAGEAAGESQAGGLVGRNEKSIIANSHSSSDVVGELETGGLVGANALGIIRDCHATGGVSGLNSIGGLVGVNERPGWGYDYLPMIMNSRSESSVQGANRVGGLVGTNMGDIIKCYASGDVTGESEEGGLVGHHFSRGNIDQCFATGKVEGTRTTGGLVGTNRGNILNSFVAGVVIGNNRVGGLAGESDGSITNSYAACRVLGFSRYTVGLFGSGNIRNLTNSYFDIELQSVVIGHRQTRKTTAEMLQMETFEDWDFDEIWTIDEGASYPYLRWRTDYVPTPPAGKYPMDISVKGAGNTYPETGLRWFEEAEVEVAAEPEENWRFSHWRLDGEHVGNESRLRVGLEEDGEIKELVAFFEIFAAGDGSEDDPYIVSSAEDLYNVRYLLDSHFKQTRDIDLSGYYENGGWEPIGGSLGRFTGSFNGNGHVIRHLKIYRPATRFVGLFGYLGEGAEVRNVALENIDVIGHWGVGGLAGRNVGRIAGNHVIGEVSGYSRVGGLVGWNEGNIAKSSSSGNFRGSNRIGGLVGYHTSEMITESYAAGEVKGGNNVGGLIGSLVSRAEIHNSYAQVDVIGEDSNIGGFAGYITNSGIYNCYSAGTLSGMRLIGGIVGRVLMRCDVENSYFDKTISGRETERYGLPRSTEEMMRRATYEGWDFDEVWAIDEEDYPYLQWQRN